MSRRRRTSRRIVGVGVVALVCCASVTGAQGDPTGAPSAGRPGVRVVQNSSDNATSVRAGRGYGIPPLTVYAVGGPNDKSTSYAGQVGRDSVATVTRSKVTANLPEVQLLSYQKVCLALPLGGGLTIQTCCPDAFDTSTCPKNDIVDYPAGSADDTGALTWSRNGGPAWAVSTSTKAPKAFGTFLPFTVRLLAFGSLPATATVNLSQPVGSDGLVSPLDIEYLELVGNVPRGTTLTGYPSPAPDELNFFDQYLRVTGKVDIRLSDVRVDEVPVDVGPDCRTRTPGSLTYSGPRGWSDASARAADLFGRPGGFQPLNGEGAGAFVGNVAISAFTGCRDGARSLDPLITALASGPTNRLTVRLKSPFFDCTNESIPAPCPAYPTVEGPADPVAQGAARTSATSRRSATSARAGARSSVAGWRALTAAQRHEAARRLAGLPARSRNAVLSTLPVEVVRAVRSAA